MVSATSERALPHPQQHRVPPRVTTEGEGHPTIRIPLQEGAHTFVSCSSEENPKPNTVLALLSAHCPNFCDVLVKVMFGVMVLLMITCRRGRVLTLNFPLLLGKPVAMGRFLCLLYLLLSCSGQGRHTTRKNGHFRHLNNRRV